MTKHTPMEIISQNLHVSDPDKRCAICKEPNANWAMKTIETNVPMALPHTFFVHHKCIRKRSEPSILKLLYNSDSNSFTIPQPRERGQSLVELAIVAPILIFMLLGVFEVGWALHTHMILTDVSREVARFSVRPEYQGVDWQQKVELKALDTVLNAGFERRPEKLTFVITRYDTEDACPTTVITQTMQFRVPSTSTVSSRISNNELQPSLDAYSCLHIQNEGAILTSIVEGVVVTATLTDVQTVPRNIVVVEIFFDQPQLFGAPFLSNSLTDPILHYTVAIMRVLVSRK